MSKEELFPAEIDEFYMEEDPVNFEKKCPLVLVLDVSSSMTGSPIKELNSGLETFQKQIQGDAVASARLETMVITFGRNVEVIRDFALFDENPIPTLHASGCTPMAEGLKMALSRIDARKTWYKEQGLQYYRPYVVLMTDGFPTSSQNDIMEIQKAIHEGVDQKRFNFWAFGVGEADMGFLEKLSHQSFPPLKLKGFNFEEFFEWLSKSFNLISNSRSGEGVNIAPAPNANPFHIDP